LSAAVDEKKGVTVAEGVTIEANDKRQMLPMPEVVRLLRFTGENICSMPQMIWETSLNKCVLIDRKGVVNCERLR